MNKIIYFDKETIQNILQEQNKMTLNKSVYVKEFEILRQYRFIYGTLFIQSTES